MSKVTIAGDVNGTGVFTIAAPNGNTNRTLTLPDEAGTLLTSAGAIAVDASAPDNSLVVTSAGNVGIGTAVPFSNLSIVGATGAGYQQIKLRQTDTAAAQRTGIAFAEYATGTQGFGIGAYSDAGINRLFIGGGANGMNSATEIKFATTSAVGTNVGTERMRIDSSGRIHVNGTYVVDVARISVSFNSADSTGIGIIATNGSGGTLMKYLNSGGSQVGAITTNASSTSYLTSSDYRLKEEWVAVADASTRVNALKPVNFAWKLNGSRVDGFLAHELAEVVPEAVAGAKDAMRDEEYEVSPAVLDDEGAVVTPAVMGTRSVPDYQGIDQSKLVPLLTAALQEALAAIEALTARVSALEAA
jgi:hypothetical protein